MAITQTQIDTLISELQDAKATAALNYAIGGLNGIRNIHLEESIVKLQVFINQLECYDLVNYDDSYFHAIRAESKQYCVPSSLSVSTTSSTEFSHARYLVTSTGSGSGSAIDSGFTLPSRSSYDYVSVNLIGYNVLTLGDGVTTTEAFFSRDGGATAVSFSNLQLGDGLYLNAVVIGAPISIIDQIEITILS